MVDFQLENDTPSVGLADGHLVGQSRLPHGIHVTKGDSGKLLLDLGVVTFHSKDATGDLLKDQLVE
jgi:hypothetical protein